MARKPSKRRSSSKQIAETQIPGGLLSLAPVTYPVADTQITALQVWQNPERKPSEPGPWDDEGDKIAWVDEQTGLGCILLRQKNGTLSGYVGVGPDHPLFGFTADAVPVDIANSVHGGVTYGKECEVNRFAREEYGTPRKERYTVCHTTITRVVRNYRTVQTTKDEFEHDDLWWFGFDTDHIGDLVPEGYNLNPRKGDVYRDQAYVYNECITFARRLHAIASAEATSQGDTAEPPRLPPPASNGGAD
ncbi:MAG: hypothetical protein KKE77_06755 [Alphaproteobacteria bacterium]|nr:hypothetical protein [Alphaproteobacteria bacterium]